MLRINLSSIFISRRGMILLLWVYVDGEYLYFQYKLQVVLTGQLGCLCHWTRILTPGPWKSSVSVCARLLRHWRASGLCARHTCLPLAARHLKLV